MSVVRSDWDGKLLPKPFKFHSVTTLNSATAYITINPLQSSN